MCKYGFYLNASVNPYNNSNVWLSINVHYAKTFNFSTAVAFFQRLTDKAAKMAVIKPITATDIKVGQMTGLLKQLYTSDV